MRVCVYVRSMQILFAKGFFMKFHASAAAAVDVAVTAPAAAVAAGVAFRFICDVCVM